MEQAKEPSPFRGVGITSQNSQGGGINEDVSFTVNAVDRHGVAPLGTDMYNHQITGQTAATLNESSCATPTRSGPSVMYYDEQNR